MQPVEARVNKLKADAGLTKMRMSQGLWINSVTEILDAYSKNPNVSQLTG